MGPGELSEKKEKICGYYNSVHYSLTDMGLDLALIKCGDSHDYVVVTNADNSYHSSFFYNTIRQKKEVVTCYFLHNAKRIIETKYLLSRVDLGAVILSTAALRRSQMSFSSSIPMERIMTNPNLSKEGKAIATLRAHHDNDWWFIQKAVHELKLESTIV